MTSPWCEVVSLCADHDLSTFDCGLEPIDTWLKTKALSNQRSVRTHVCLDDLGGVVAFFALKTIIVPVEGLSNAQRRGNMANQSIGILLCQMGVNKDLQGNGSGKQLLKKAMLTAVENHQKSPVQLFVVDAHNDSLVSYYEDAGLKLVPNSLRLIATMKVVEKAVAD